MSKTYKFALMSKEPLAHKNLVEDLGGGNYLFETSTKARAITIAADILKCSKAKAEKQVVRFEPEYPRIVNLNPHTATKLKEFRDKLQGDFGTRVSYSDTIAHLLRL